MSTEMVKIIVQYIISPLVLGIIGIVMAFYRRDLKELKASVTSERISRKEETGLLFEKLDTIADTLGDVKAKTYAQEKVCNERHRVS